MKKQNILIIICDQLSAGALSFYGNTYSRTPNLDRLAAEGVQFENAYTTCPLCQPARASFWTSKYPHQTNVRTNLPDQGFSSLPTDIPTLGELFSAAGYRSIHFGKTHDYGSLRGFEIVESQQVKISPTHLGIIFDYETYLDVDTTDKTVEFLNESHHQPFLAVADFQNPHNICAYIGANAEGHLKDFPLDRELPPLPENFAFEDIKNRPPVIQYLCCGHRRQRHASKWQADDYRHYLYAYYYYLEMVDKQIGQVLTALKENDLEKDTMVVFFADHGEGMAAHGMVTKYAAFYEETNHVPFLFKIGNITAKKSISGAVSLIDLAPTLLDYAGLVIPKGMEGNSLLPQLIGDDDEIKNGCVYGEWHDEFRGYTVPGRMVCDGSYKYICYLEEMGEELYDLQEDSLEQYNLANRPEYYPVVEAYRQKLQAFTEKTNDDFYRLHTLGTEGYRHHPLGFCNHRGLSAVEVYARSLKGK